MANYAKIVHGRVENVIVAEPEWIATQIQDTYILSTEENIACVDGSIVDGIFVGPQIYSSWTLGDDYKWHPPVPLPENSDSVMYKWDEFSLSWIEIIFN